MNLGFAEFYRPSLGLMPALGSLSLTLIHAYPCLGCLAFELEILLLLCHPVTHESPRVTGCTSLLRRVDGHLLSILIAILSNPLILLFSFTIALSNRLVGSLRQIVGVA